MKKTIITMEKTKYIKEGSKWIEFEKQTEKITEEQYYYIIDSRSYFTKLGGYERHHKNYTCEGYIVTEINSISPDRKNKTLREFTLNRVIV
jgi:hypothetical protein